MTWHKTKHVVEGKYRRGKPISSSAESRNITAVDEEEMERCRGRLIRKRKGQIGLADKFYLGILSRETQKSALLELIQKFPPPHTTILTDLQKRQVLPQRRAEAENRPYT
jgi:hypothetical protein